MGTSKIKVNEVQHFIRRILPNLLQTDLQGLKMVREADLECCAYFHLRDFLKKDFSWKILARKYAPTKHFVDLLLFRKEKPRISLELKWNKQSIGKKDKRSLSKSLKQLLVNRAYFISTITKGEVSEKQKVFTQKILPYNIKGIFIPLGKQGDQFDQWQNNRKQFTSQMSKGRAKHKQETNRSADGLQPPLISAIKQGENYEHNTRRHT